MSRHTFDRMTRAIQRHIHSVRVGMCAGPFALCFLVLIVNGRMVAAPDHAQPDYPLVMEFTTALAPGDWQGYVIGPSSLDRAYLAVLEPLSSGSAGDFINEPRIQAEYNGLLWRDVLRLSIPADKPGQTVRVRVYDVSALPVIMDFTALLEPGVWYGWIVGPATADQGAVAEMTPLEPSIDGAHVIRDRIRLEPPWDVLRVMMSPDQPAINVNMRVRAITTWPVATEFVTTLEPGTSYQFPIGPAAGDAAYVVETTTDATVSGIIRSGIVLRHDGERWNHVLDLETRDQPSDGPVETQIRIWQLPHDVAPNVVANPDFEEGPPPWAFYTNGRGSFVTVPDPYNGANAATAQIAREGTNVQLYQAGIRLEPDQHYRLRFAAKAGQSSGLGVFLHKHTYPYTNYGLRNFEVTLGTEWQLFTTEFTTHGFSAPVDDARLRFWLAPYDEDGIPFFVDSVYLEKVVDGLPPIPEPDPEPPAMPEEGHCTSVPGNILDNPGFEAATSPWAFYTNDRGWMQATADTRYECLQSARLHLTGVGTNMQLYQAGLGIQSRATHTLRFAAKSSLGGDVTVFLHQHVSPYVNYGLNGVTFDLTQEWQVFQLQFTSTNRMPVEDARLRFWFTGHATAGEEYWIDDVVLAPAAELAAAAGPGGTRRPVGTFLRSGYYIDDRDDAREAGGPLPQAADACGNAVADPAVLRPANRQMTPITIAGIDGSVRIDAIYQDEPVYVAPGRETLPDGEGKGTGSVATRAERIRTGDGRVYHIVFSAMDGSDVRCTGTVTVGVPSGRGHPAVDGGPLYDSTIMVRPSGSTWDDTRLDEEPGFSLFLPHLVRQP